MTLKKMLPLLEFLLVASLGTQAVYVSTRPPYIPESPRYPTTPPYIPETPRYPTTPPYIPETPRYPTTPTYFPQTPRYPSSPPYIPETPQYTTTPPYFPPTPRFPTTPPYFPQTPRYPITPSIPQTPLYPRTPPYIPSTQYYVVTNAEMQASIRDCSSALSSLASRGPYPSSNELMRKVVNALNTIHSLSYDNQALTQLSPHILRMRTATSLTRNCRQNAIPEINLNNLNSNMVWWGNGGYNPTQQHVQNLINTASLCIERYC